MGRVTVKSWSGTVRSTVEATPERRPGPHSTLTLAARSVRNQRAAEVLVTSPVAVPCSRIEGSACWTGEKGLPGGNPGREGEVQWTRVRAVAPRIASLTSCGMVGTG